MNIPLLNDIVIIFSLAVAVLFICHRFRLPTAVGFFLTGIVVGPSGLAVVKGIHEVEIFAEIGVILLLFKIGIEFSLFKLMQTGKFVLKSGFFQVTVTVLAAFFLAGRTGREPSEALFMGFLVALSSTAIVLNQLQQRAEIGSPPGRISLGILVFQDLIVVPMILLTPLLGGEAAGIGRSLLVLLAKGILIILLVLIAARWIVPHAL